MKRALLTAVFVVVVTLASMVLTQAGVSPVLSVNVPFSFTVGKATLPAGHYTVQLDRISSGTALGTCLVVRNDDRAVVQRIKTLPNRSGELRSGASLLFHKYGDSYFLAEVQSYGLGCELTQSPAEKEMASRPSQGGGTVAVAAE